MEELKSEKMILIVLAFSSNPVLHSEFERHRHLLCYLHYEKCFTETNDLKSGLCCVNFDSSFIHLYVTNLSNLHLIVLLIWQMLLSSLEVRNTYNKSNFGFSVSLKYNNNTWMVGCF